MTEKHLMTNIERVPLMRAMLIGAVIGLIPMALFISGVNHPMPEWGALWMIRPLVVISFAGAIGGACAYILNLMTRLYKWSKVLTVIISVIIFVFGLWIGTVLGLAGTLWH